MRGRRHQLVTAAVFTIVALSSALYVLLSYNARMDLVYAMIGRTPAGPLWTLEDVGINSFMALLPWALLAAVFAAFSVRLRFVWLAPAAGLVLVYLAAVVVGRVAPEMTPLTHLVYRLNGGGMDAAIEAVGTSVGCVLVFAAGTRMAARRTRASS